MVRRLMLLVALTAAASAGADPIIVSRARNSVADLTNTVNVLVKEAQRDAEVLRYLREAARSLDDWQKNNAVAGALTNITRAEQLAAQPPITPRVTQAVTIARQIVAPARESAMSADLLKLRGELQSRPIEQMRGIVAEEVGVLADLAAQLSDVSSTLTKSVAASTSTTLGSKSQ